MAQALLEIGNLPAQVIELIQKDIQRFLGYMLPLL
jgi:hypothetical protein